MKHTVKNCVLCQSYENSCDNDMISALIDLIFSVFTFAVFMCGAVSQFYTNAANVYPIFLVVMYLVLILKSIL